MSIERELPINASEIDTLNIIEELEQKIAPDGGETVLPLGHIRHR